MSKYFINCDYVSDTVISQLLGSHYLEECSSDDKSKNIMKLCTEIIDLFFRDVKSKDDAKKEEQLLLYLEAAEKNFLVNFHRFLNNIVLLKFFGNFRILEGVN